MSYTRASIYLKYFSRKSDTNGRDIIIKTERGRFPSNPFKTGSKKGSPKKERGRFPIRDLLKLLIGRGESPKEALFGYKKAFKGFLRDSYAFFKAFTEGVPPLSKAFLRGFYPFLVIV